MSRRRNLEHHRQSLSDIRDIMDSMKTLAYIENRKLSRFLDAQHAVVHSIENVASDFLSFYPEKLPDVMEATPVFLLIGSERGFCGDFNHSLFKYLESCLPVFSPVEPVLIAIGRKLHPLLESNTHVVAQLGGASIVEEIPTILNQLINDIVFLQGKYGALKLFGLYHGSEDGVVMQRLLPPFHGLPEARRYTHPPILNLSTDDFFIELIDQYLFAALHAMLYTSLMMENHHRVTHLEGAVNHLDEQTEDLLRECNILRQEEIIEEIEVILLSATSLDVNNRLNRFSGIEDENERH